MKSNIGEVIKRLRKEKGLTQKELAEKIGISDKAISHWETGENLPDIDMINLLRKFFKVNLNDLVVARAKDEADEELVQDIINEFTETSKKKNKIIQIIILIFFLVVLILTMTIIFTNSYNRFKVYKVTIDSNDMYPLHGIYVETKIKDSLFLENIRLKRYEIKSTDSINVNLYYLENNKKIILYNSNSLNNFQFYTYDSYIKIDDLSDYFDNLYLEVNIIDSKNIVHEYTAKLIFTLDFSNNKIYSYKDRNTYLKSNDNLSLRVISKILLDNDFNITNDIFLIKIDGKYTINYNKVLNFIELSFKKSDFTYKYYYYFSYNIMKVSIFDDNNIEIENYKYDITNNKIIECNIGKCNSYEEALKILNEKVLYLFKDKIN